MHTALLSIPTAPSLEPDTYDCKLHNTYSVQSCILAGISLLLGTVVCFYGYRVFKFILFLAGFLAGFFFTYMLCYGYLVDQLSGKYFEHKDQIFLGISAGVGIIVGLLTLCIFYVGLFVLGAALGWFVGMFLLPLLYKHSEYLSEHTWMPYLILSAFALAGGILILCIQKVIIIISSSFLGAFGCINGFDYFLENSKALYYAFNILHGHYNKASLPHCWYTWFVVSLIPVMFIAGVVVQFRKTGKGRDHRRAYGRESSVRNTGTPLDECADRQPILTDFE